MTIAIGLIGYGSWAREAYVPAVLECGGVEVQAVAARSEGTRRLAAETFGPGAEIFGDPFRLLDDAAVDAVMIGLPSELVSAVGIASIQAGKHVWAEPPPPGDARVAEMLDLADESDRVFHADLELRCLPVVAAVKNLLRAKLGPPLSVRVSLQCNWANTWGADALERGAIASGLSIWYLDAIDALMDGRPKRVDVMGARPRFDSAIETGAALVEYDGAVGEWAFNLRSPAELSLRLEVAALDGEAEADLATGQYRYRAGSPSWVEGAAPPAQPIHGFAGMQECAAAFLHAIQGSCETPTGPSVLRQVHAAATAFDESAKSGTAAAIVDYD